MAPPRRIGESMTTRIQIGILRVLAVCFIGVIDANACGGWRSRPTLVFARPDRAALEKQIAKLEGQVESLKKELRDARREPQAEKTVKIVPLSRLTVDEAIKVLRFVYGASPKFEVAPLADTKCLMIKADEQTMAEIIKFLKLVQ